MHVLTQGKEGDMQKTQLAQVKRNKEVRAEISYFSLEGLLPPGQTLALNLPTRTLSLLSDGPELISVQQFSDNEISVIVPILESFPHYCPYEVLLAHISSSSVTEASITRCRQRLREAQESRGRATGIEVYPSGAFVVTKQVALL